MRPSPKLPTSTSLLNVPKSPAASANPHGEFSVPRDATRRISLPLVSNAFTNPWPLPRTSSLLFLVLQRVGDVDDAADVLDSERRVAFGNAVIDESALGKLHEVMVEDVDRAGAEIRGVQKIAGNIAGDRAGDRESFVDGTIGGRHCDDRLARHRWWRRDRRRDRGIPTRDRAVLAGEDEAGGTACA